MTTYVMVVVSEQGAKVNEVNFTREELHMCLNALEIHDAEADRYDLTPAGEELKEKLERICYDFTDWEDIEPDQDQPVLQGSNE